MTELGSYDDDQGVPWPDAAPHEPSYSTGSRRSPADPFEGRLPPEEPRPRFPALPLDMIELSDEPPFLIDGLMPATGFAVVVGLPKSLKSFLLADALFHVTMGQPWAGRDVMQGAVVYVTGEGVSGFKRRLVAMRRHYGVEGQGVPFVLVPVAPDLGRASGDAETLIETIRECLNAIGNPPLRAVAVDTLARSMKGADENAAKDMTAFVDNCGQIGSAFGCIVVAVHHSGKDATKGARGSNALDGACDCMWGVERGEASSLVSIVYMKDAEAGASWHFRLVPYPLPQQSAKGESVAGAVVEIVTLPGGAQQPATKRGKPLPDRPRLLLDILNHAISEMGEHAVGDLNVPRDIRAIRREHLKKYLEHKGYWDDLLTPEMNRSYLSRDIKTLVARKIAGSTASWLWVLS
jgi:hypothetical protein